MPNARQRAVQLLIALLATAAGVPADPTTRPADPTTTPTYWLSKASADATDVLRTHSSPLIMMGRIGEQWPSKTPDEHVRG